MADPHLRRMNSMTRPTEHGSRLTINGLEEAASKPDVDPCDVACEAMPARVVGDLSEHDVSWLLEHTDDCNYCANELRRYDRLGEALTAVGAIEAEPYAPPPVALPRRERVWYTRVDSPIGELILAATAEGLREIEFGSQVSDADFVGRQRERGVDPVRLERIEDAAPDVQVILRRAASELREYFGGQRARFDIPLDWGRMAPFQRAVLEATATVPFGRVDTYAGIARKIGKPGATRAVGNALGRNPIPVIVPCHRVIRSDATIGGYTGGLGIKHRLLAIEGVTLT
jgi:methylated-DNA-[protein]-cysteine S-methyltransferase